VLHFLTISSTYQYTGCSQALPPPGHTQASMDNCYGNQLDGDMVQLPRLKFLGVHCLLDMVDKLHCQRKACNYHTGKLWKQKHCKRILFEIYLNTKSDAIKNSLNLQYVVTKLDQTCTGWFRESQTKILIDFIGSRQISNRISWQFLLGVAVNHKIRLRRPCCSELITGFR